MAVIANRTSSTHIASGKKVDFKFKLPGYDFSYPKEWFERNSEIKPTASIPNYTGEYKSLADAVVGGISGVSLTLNTAKVFLHHYGRDLRETLDDDWTSFGRAIGVKDRPITPWDIVTIVPGADHIPTENLVGLTPAGGRDFAGDPNKWTLKALALYIVCVYQLLRVSNEAYREQLTKRMEDQLAVEGGKGMSLNGVSGVYGNWINDPNYTKMIAALDMFFYKFKHHDSAILRMGTLSSRFRDCAALLSFGYALTMLNIQAGDLMDWVFIKSMGDEVVRVSEDQQESGEEHSYFPYQADQQAYHNVFKSSVIATPLRFR